MDADYPNTGVNLACRFTVFHSIRKTVTTLLENAGVAEGTAADLVGHDKQTITYGLYSGGTSIERLREAIKKLEYPETQISDTA